MKTMTEYAEKMEAKLTLWKAQLDAMALKAVTVGADAKVDYHKRIADLKTRQEAARDKLAELKAAGATKWEGFKAGVESAWEDLEAAFKKSPD
jgi:hypothetical protein